MPEGDTVWLAASRMRDALGGRVLTRVELRVPAFAASDLTGHRVLDVVPRGKHMLTRLDGDLTLHTHFRMDGSWHLYRPGDRWRGGPQWQVRALLATAEWTAVGYRLRVVDLLPTSEEERVVGHLGPDVLGPDWDPAEVLRRMSADPTREVGPALLDQRNLAGVGNLYKTETLFLRGITPWTRVEDIRDLAGVVGLAQRLMAANRGRWQQSTTGRLTTGETHWAFERAGRACRRCDELIRRAEQGEPPRQRLSYWCPRCQVGPTPGG